MVNNDTSSNGPIFLVGMPRSGTKLLRTLLNKHPLIFINDVETEFLPYLVNHWSSFGDISDLQHFHSFYAHMVQKPYFFLRKESGKLVSAEEWHAACHQFTPAGVFEAMTRVDTKIPSASEYIWGDKSPSYINHLMLIKTLYPSSRFIHIIRDVRDYCLSIKKAWGKDMLRAAQRWSEGVEAARTAGVALGECYVEINYESLLIDTETELQRICTFLGIDFKPEMLTLDGSCENLGDAVGATRVLSGNTKKFTKLMDRKTLTKIEALAGHTLVSCGYPLMLPPQPQEKLSKLQMFMAQLRDALNLFRYGSHKRGGIWGSIKFYLSYFKTTHSG